MEQTALQQMIDLLENEEDYMDAFYANKERLLELEKKQIIDAHIAGQTSCAGFDRNEIKSSTYYEKTYSK